LSSEHRHKHAKEDQTCVMNFDGLCEPKNPGGIATYGVTIKKNGKVIHEENGLADAVPWTSEASNNVAEYSGIVHGLRWLVSHGFNKSPVIVRGDSKLVISQLSGTFKVKAPRIVDLYKKAVELADHFHEIHYEWVNRELNSDADLLSRIAYSRYIKKTRARGTEKRLSD